MAASELKSARGDLINTLLNPNETLELFNTHYSLGEAQTCTLIRRGFNDHYLIELGAEKYIFRVYLNHKYYTKSPDAFQFELDLLEHLHQNNVPVAYLLPLSSGKTLGWTNTDLGERAFALFVFVEGEEVEAQNITLKQSFEFGKTIAEFHLAANTFETKLERYRLDLNYLVDEPLRLLNEQGLERSKTIPAQDRKIIREMVASLQPIEELVDRVKQLSVDSQTFGIIHADMHVGNVHFQGDNVTLFDFDHCAHGWRVYDLATSFFLPEARRAALLKGYESVRPLSSSERECLPVFAKLRNLWNVGDVLAAEPAQAEPQA